MQTELIWTWGLDPLGMAMQIRTEVFVVEQQVPPALELDEYDPRAWHLVARCDGNPLGTLRLFSNDQGDWLIGRMAVRAPYRGQGYGRLLMETALEKAQALGVRRITLHAQTHALAFYDKLGFVAYGEEFMDAGIPHFHMVWG